jgi:uncharacterized protein YlxW (UPF0749 family)
MPADNAGTTGRPVGVAGSRAGPDAPPQTTMGLLDYLTAHSMDEDYAHVAEREPSSSEPRQNRSGAAALLVLGLFGLLVATAAVQTSRNAVEAEDGHQQLVTQIQARSAQVDARRARVTSLREEVDSLRAQFLDTTAQGRAMADRLDRLGVNTGASAVTGPGVRAVVDDAPGATSAQQRVLDQDLARLVNVLWEVGAEAIAINGQRLSNLTAIRHAGSAIVVNRSLSPPYVVSAIGGPNMAARFVESSNGSAWLDTQATFGLQFDMTTEERLTLPAADRLKLRYATTPGDRQ